MKKITLVCMSLVLFMSETAGAIVKTYNFKRSNLVPTNWNSAGWCMPGSIYGGRNYDSGNITMTYTDSSASGAPFTGPLNSAKISWKFNSIGNTMSASLNGNLIGSGYDNSGSYCTTAKLMEPSAPLSSYNFNGTNTATLRAGDTYNYDVVSSLTGDASKWDTDPWVVVTIDFGPTPISPKDAGYSNSTTPEIRWTASPGATSYRLEIDDTPFFNGSNLINKIVTGTSYTLSGTAPEPRTNGVSYYMRLTAQEGIFAGQSDITDFTVDTTAPSAPSLTSPADNATGLSQTPTFNWTSVTSGDE